jgi:NADPH-dependent 2,4-dienoyl-CoA reductase/sulfur reductase-like enzyme/Pyruvate/2-oxoacid:ferredoxin oxidoreductase delta subunit/bacterioferritin-associated ferredoxin
MGRIEHHPVLEIKPRGEITFSFNGRVFKAKEGEVISSALIANGIHVFGHHRVDGAPQGIYCANGQCSQCMVIANGIPVKACMTGVREGMVVQSCSGYPVLPEDNTLPGMKNIGTFRIPVLIIGGGPAGLSAAIELARFGVRAILVDDKQKPGGKLTLQTHNFFGSHGDCFAGTRGIDIGLMLEEELGKLNSGSIEVWLNSPAVAVFCDGKVGVVKNGEYVLVKPQVLLVASGAREKALAFPGCDLPGIYGAGAFQTLSNRDLVRPTGRLFICGGGNVGLISGYHAIQAGIEVVGLAEALPECGGYRVHLEKLLRFGVPVYTSHSVVRAEGKEHLEAVTIAGVDNRFRPVSGTEKTFRVDTLLLAVGLSPVRELYIKAKEYGMKVYAAGDAEEISEASAAIFSGRIAGRRIAEELGKRCIIPAEWNTLIGTLRSKPGWKAEGEVRTLPGRVYPVIRCHQEIPCDPCVYACPKGMIKLRGSSIKALPSFDGDDCLGCARCVVVCPGLAILLVDERYDPEKKHALITMPIEIENVEYNINDTLETVGRGGEVVGTGRLIAFRKSPWQNRRTLILLEVPYGHRLAVSGVRLKKNPAQNHPENSSGCYNKNSEELSSVRNPEFYGKSSHIHSNGYQPGFSDKGGHISEQSNESNVDCTEDKNKLGSYGSGDEQTIICRCERVSKGRIVEMIRAGCRDMNQIKAVLRTGMGACGGKTCTELILGLFREEGVDLSEVRLPTSRPPEMEVPLGNFAGIKGSKKD